MAIGMRVIMKRGWNKYFGFLIDERYSEVNGKLNRIQCVSMFELDGDLDRIGTGDCA